jgi:hypothetical protein
MNQANTDAAKITKGIHVPSSSGQDKVEDIDEDFAHLKEGHDDVSSGKKIKKIIMADHDYIVFLDDKDQLEWSVTHKYASVKKDFSELFGEVVSRVTELEGLAETFITSDKQKRESKILLGATVVLMLEKEKNDLIHQALQKAEQYIKDRMTERARTWFLVSSSGVTLLAVIGMLIVGLLRSGVIDRFGTTGYDVLLGTGMGAIGALISIIVRTNKLPVSMSAGRLIACLEAAARVVVGMLGGLLIALAIKSEIFFSVLNTASNPLAVLLTVCTVAGASERIVPSLVKKVEGMTEEEKAAKTTQ